MLQYHCSTTACTRQMHALLHHGGKTEQAKGVDGMYSSMCARCVYVCGGVYTVATYVLGAERNEKSCAHDGMVVPKIKWWKC